MKATQVSAIKAKLTGKGIAKAVLYFAKWRLKLPLWENSPAMANEAATLSIGQGHTDLGARVSNQFACLCAMF